jgi:flagellin
VNNIPAGDYQITLEDVKPSTPGTISAPTGAGLNDFIDNLTLELTNTNATGAKITATIYDIDESAETVTVRFTDGTHTEDYTFTAGATATTADVELWSGVKIKAGAELDGNTEFDQLKKDMQFNIDLAGAGNKMSATGVANFNTFWNALTQAQKDAFVVVKDAHGNILNDYEFSIDNPVDATAADDFHIKITTLNGIDGADLLTGAGSAEYMVKIAQNTFTTANGVTFTFNASTNGLDDLDTIALGNSDVTTITSKAATGEFSTYAPSASDITSAGVVTLTVVGQTPSFDPTKGLEITVETESVVTSAGNLHIKVKYEGNTYGAYVKPLGSLVGTGGATLELLNTETNLGFDIVLTNPATAPTWVASQDTVFTYIPPTAGVSTLISPDGTKGGAAAADFATGAELAELTLTSTNANQDTDIVLKVTGKDVATGEVAFDAFTVDANGARTAGGTLTLNSINGTVGGSGAVKDLLGTNLSSTFGTNFAINEVSIGEELTYTVAAAKADNVILAGLYGAAASSGAATGITLTAASADANASILLEVEDVNDTTGSVIFKGTSNILYTNGSVTTKVSTVTLNGDKLSFDSLGVVITANLDNIKANPTNDTEKASAYFKKGDKLAYNILTTNSAANSVFTINGDQNTDWSGSWETAGSGDKVLYGSDPLQYGLTAASIDGQEIHFKNFYINEEDGTVYTGDIVLDLAKDFSTKGAKTGDTLASFTAAYVGQVAKGDVKLNDLDKFWNSEGRSLLKDPQTLTITQGDGTKTSVTLYATDTLNDVATKLNLAIAQHLGQGRLLTITPGTAASEDPHKAAQQFVTFVDSKQEGTSEAAEGTFVIRSAVAGDNGEISFAGDEELINKLSLNEIQASAENSFTVSVWDAHSGKAVASSVKITGNKLIGVVNENVDVVFDAMANVKVEWNDATKSFSLSKESNSYQTILHLADNTTVFQIGANEGEDMGVNIGDMRAEALGLNSVLVTDRESAARSVTVIDNAIDRVSMQRAKIGAYQNRLEHTITNLTVAGENLTAAESLIRDTDMAKEMMNFTKLQIMLQAGTSMLAQANTLPQNVLSLIR